MLQALSKTDWNYTTAAHLLNRAGFGGPPREIEELLALGPAGAVAKLLDFGAGTEPPTKPDWAKPDPDRAERLQKARQADEETRRKMQQEEQRTQRLHGLELKHWWLQAMTESPYPLREKLTLFWHGHFATSTEKVRDAYLMWRQNDLFRKHAAGNWPELITAVAQDPAMLVWLDQAQSRKEHPNENFARELLELFTLGEGHYTEKDVTEAARGLTGWSFDRVSQEFVRRPGLHDAREKTFLGKTGPLAGMDIVATITEQPQAARFITAKLWHFFAGEEPSAELAEALAGVFRESHLEFRPLLAALFASQEFYAPGLIRNQVKSPVQWLVGAVRTLERPLPAAVVCQALTRNLGQDLFAPPNVKGWDGGLSWITTNNLLARYNEAAVLAQGDATVLRGLIPGGPNGAPAGGPGGAPGGAMAERLANARLRSVNPARILTPAERADKARLVAALEQRLLQSRLRPKQEAVLQDYLSGVDKITDDVVRNTIRLIMSTPEYQLT